MLLLNYYSCKFSVGLAWLHWTAQIVISVSKLFYAFVVCTTICMYMLCTADWWLWERKPDAGYGGWCAVVSSLFTAATFVIESTTSSCKNRVWCHHYRSVNVRVISKVVLVVDPSIANIWVHVCDLWIDFSTRNPEMRQFIMVNMS